MPDIPVLLRSERTLTQQIVARVFRPLLVKVCTGYLVLLCLIAIFVPFIANGVPYTMVIPGSSGQPAVRMFPLFRDLASVDLILLVVAGAFLIYLIAHFCTRKEKALARVRHRRTWFLWLTAAATVASILIAIFHQNRLDALDYRDMASAGQVSDAIFAPIRWGYADQEPLSANLINQMPDSRHVLGTDTAGRDILSRLLWSTRIAMGVGFVSQIIALTIGVLVGALAGYFGGIVDILGMRLVEIVESVPTFFLILTFVAIYGRDIFIIMVIIGVVGWTGYTRLLRGEFLRIRQIDYVTAARAGGIPLWRILFKHILPNGLTPVLVSASFGFAGAVSLESMLSYLGVGVAPPTPSWGDMLNSAGNPAVVFHWWEALFPGFLLFLTILAFIYIGESLRDAIDPTSLERG